MAFTPVGGGGDAPAEPQRGPHPQKDDKRPPRQSPGQQGPHPSEAPEPGGYSPTHRAGVPTRREERFGPRVADPQTNLERLQNYLSESERDDRLIEREIGALPDTKRWRTQNFVERLDHLESVTAGKLPADIQIALAQIDSYKSAVEAVARELAMADIIPIDDLLHPYIKSKNKSDNPNEWTLEDPRTGNSLSFDQMKQYLPVIELNYLTQLLQAPVDKTVGEPILARGGKANATLYGTREVPVDPVRVLKFWKALEPRFGSDLSMRAGLASAIGLAADNISADKFAEALDKTRGLFSDLSGARQIAMAHLATKSKVNLDSPQELLAFRMMVKEKMSEEEIKRALSAFAGASDTSEFSDILAQEMVDQGLQGDPDVVAGIISQNSNIGSTAGAAGMAGLNLVQAMQRPNSDKAILEAYKSFLEGVEKDKLDQEQKISWEDIPVVSNTFHFLGNQIHRLENFSTAAGGQIVATGNHAYNVVRAWQNGTLEEDGEALQQHWAESYDAAQRMWSQDEDFIEWGQEYAGWTPTQSMWMGMLFEIVLDPTIVGGKILAVTKAEKYARFSKLYTGGHRVAEALHIPQVKWGSMAAKLLDKRRLALGFTKVEGKAVPRLRRVYDVFIDEGLAAIDNADSMHYHNQISPALDELRVSDNASYVDNIAEDVASGRLLPGDLTPEQFADAWNSIKRAGRTADPDSELGIAYRIFGKHADTAGIGVDELHARHVLEAEAARQGRYYTRVESSFSHRWRNQYMDRTFLDATYAYLVRARKMGLSRAQMEADMRNLTLMGLGAKSYKATGLEKYLLESAAKYNELKAYNESIGLGTRNAKTAEEFASLAEMKALRRDIDDMEDLRKGWGYGGEGHQRLDYVPKPTFRGALARSVSFDNDSRFRAALSALNNVYVGPFIDIEKDINRQVGRLLKRSRVFRDPAEIEVWSLRVRQAARLDNPNRAQDVRKTIEAMNQDLIHRIASDLGISPHIADLISERMVSDIKKQTDFAMGIDDKGKVIDELRWETQELNRVMVVDPLEIRAQLHRRIGMMRSFDNGMRKILGKHAKPIPLERLVGGGKLDAEGQLILKETAAYQGLDATRDLNEKIMKLWKPIVVIAPRYIFRVPLLEEQLRFIAELGILGRLGATKAYANAMKKIEGGAAGSWAAKKALRSRQVEYLLDARSSLAVTNELAEAGFNDMDEAVSLLRAGAKDPRLDEISDTTKKLLEDARLDEPEGFDLSGTVLDDTYQVNNYGPQVSRMKNNLTHGEDWRAGKGIYLTKGKWKTGKSTPTRVRVTTPLDMTKPLEPDSLNAIVNAVVPFVPDEIPVAKIREFFKAPGKGNVWERLEKLAPGKADEIIEQAGFDGILGKTPDGDDFVKVMNGDQVVAMSEKAPQFWVKQRIPRAGELIDEGDIGSGLAYSAFHDLRIQGVRTAAEAQDKVRLGKIGYGEKGYSKTWAHHLNNQIARSAMGKQILRGIVNGLDEDGLVNSIVKWVDEMRTTPDGQAILKRMGLSATKPAGKQLLEIRSRVNIARDLTMHTTPGTGKALAQAALDNMVTPKMLDKVGDAGPDIVGWKIDQFYEKGEGWKAAPSFMAKTILETPTNKLARQPFFKAWYTKARKAMREQSVQAGIELSEETLRDIDRQARIFALERLQDVMFDFREQGRIAEMLSFVAPFMQPWMEQYQVWGRMIMDKPYLIGYGRWAYNNALETGFIRYDEETGERYVPMGPFSIIGEQILDNVVGEAGAGEGWSIMGNLANFNFFTQNTITMNTPIGDFPLPIPGFSPQVMVVGQRLMKKWGQYLPDWMEYRAKNWAYQYGSLGFESFLPSWSRRVLKAWEVLPGSQEEINRMADRVVTGWYAEGYTAKEFRERYNAEHPGQTITAEQARVMMAENARDTAKSMIAWSGIFQAVFPTSPYLESSTKPLYDEWYDLRRDYGNDYYGALEAWEKRYKDDVGKWIIPVSTSFWAGDPTAEGFDASVLDESGPLPLPASSFVRNLWQDKDFKRFAQNDPILAWMMLPAMAFDPNNADLQGRLWQVDEGWRLAKDPLTYIEDADARIAYQQKAAVYASWANTEEMLAKAGIEYGNDIYMHGGTITFNGKSVKVQGLYDRDQALEEIDELYPQVEDKYSRADISMYTDLSLGYLMSNPIVSETPLGRATITYMKWREKTMEEMSKKNITTDDFQEMEKIRAERDMVWEDILERTPEWAIAREVFFGDDFEYRKEMPSYGAETETKSDKFIDWLDEDETRETWYSGWQNNYKSSYEGINNPETLLDGEIKEDMYLRLRELQIQAADKAKIYGFNPQERWFEEMTTPAFRRQYKLEASLRFAPYLGMFDKKVLGVKTNSETEEMWASIAAMEVSITKRRAASATVDSGALYDARNAKVKEYMRANPLFATQVKNANKWGYYFFNNSPFTSDKKKYGKQTKAWDYLQNFVWEVQQQWNIHKIWGDGDYNDVNAQYARDSRAEVRSYIDYLSKESPLFRRQVLAIGEATGERLEDILVPEFYAPLGGVYSNEGLVHEV